LGTDNKITVLHIGLSKGLGGIETFLLNVYRIIDRDNVKFDFVSYVKNYALEFDALGASVYPMPSLKNPVRYFSFLSKLLKRKQYDIIHFHKNSAANIVPIVAVKLLGAKKIFIHSHNTNPSVSSLLIKMLHFIDRPLLNAIADKRLACSEAAGAWLFGKRAAKAGQVTVIRSGTDMAKFRFNPEARDAVRKELDVADKYVIGHVGRFSPQKNHAFLIDVFAEVAKKEPNAMLISVGEGELKPQIEKKVRTLGLANKVLLLSYVKDVDRIYQAMDVFVMPSLYEGYPLASVEAMAAGLPCVLADRITQEFDLNCSCLSLESGVSAWAKEILIIKANEAKRDCELYISDKWDSMSSANGLKELYLKGLS
jgi:glycosyltransferase involved in cell wall biosynthesis